MSDNQLEDVLRATFREQEDLVEARELAGPARARAARQRRGHALLTAAAVVAVVGAGVASVQALRHDPAPTAVAAPKGWRAESMYGVQIHVPPHWTRGPIGCGANGDPVVARADEMSLACMPPPEPVTKEVAYLGGIDLPDRYYDPAKPLDAPPGVAVTRRTLTIGGHPAVRAEFRLPDGRYAGWVRPEGAITVSVRALSAETTRQVLDSVELVTVDANGCATDPPRATRPQPPAIGADAFVPVTATSVARCYYGDDGKAMHDSDVLTGAEARTLITALNRAAPGTNPTCRGKTGILAPPALVLHARDAGGATLATVYLRTAGCIDRGLDNGARRARITGELLGDIAGGIGGYTFPEDLNP